MATSLPIHDYQPVNVFWGGSGAKILIGTCPFNRASSFAREWFAENDHFFHLEAFPPYQRMWGDKNCVKIDYGSHVNFLYCIPTK